MKPGFLLLTIVIISACSSETWNNPYPASDREQRIYYDAFSERPRHLDPVASYSENEYVFLGQIYEPILQYHFLKRPYELTTLTATEIPVPRYFDKDGKELSQDADASVVAEARYRISIKPGIRYQPHPALAKSNDNYLYHDLSTDDLTKIHTLADFNETGSRELTAQDYVYQIKRMAHPATHSPIAGLMSKYILGLDELGKTLSQIETGPNKYIDLREFDLKGVRLIDRYEYEIVLKEKYPQFIYWLSMYFFSPMPWEADVFYNQPGLKERNITLDWYPIGTGAFMLTENNPNRRMIMERNPNFRGEAYPSEGDESDREKGFLKHAGKEMPFIDKAVYSLEKESIPTWNKFLQGYYDTSVILSDSFDQTIQITAEGEVDLTEQMKEREITTGYCNYDFNLIHRF